ncbi:hypothetical protein PhCBS80983_g05569 [Powellomyces hirtus]|uniref:Uncharacterized protein n=1 Tax=Powellomyces hirtus TaxID=109895 RepID=A0A507DV28_9FUNG|nr:hypothetical protein PhCBS80983_g05569 [Powellomyces hirtus]
MPDRNSLSPKRYPSSPYRHSPAPYRTAYASPAPDATNQELRQCLREALRSLREKDESLEKKDSDLVMAAELGSSLLEDNERLKSECARLLAEYQSTAAAAVAAAGGQTHDHHEDHTQPLRGSTSISFSSPTQTTNSLLFSSADAKRRVEAVEATAAARTADLEATIIELQTQLDRVRQDVRSAQEADRGNERRALRLEGELEVATRDLDSALSRCQELDEEKKKLAKEKGDLARKVKESGDRDKELEELSELRDHTRALEDAVVQLTHARAEMEAELSCAVQDREITIQRCEELEAMTEDIRGESERQIARNDELLWDLESARDMIGKLEARLAVLEPKPDGANDVGDRTLFSEVEDRRQELETRHVSLSQKHAGLMKAHSMTIHQQERMRNHISRLTQLTNAREGELRVRLLEEALGQSESERQELQHKITLLEKDLGTDFQPIGNVGGSGRVQSGGSQADYEVELECLRLRVAQLTTEHDESKRELRTLRMLKSFETEKLRSVEALLREREEELQRLKAVNAQIRFDLEEAKARAKQQRERQRLHDDPNTSITAEELPIPVTKSVEVQTIHGQHVSQAGTQTDTKSISDTVRDDALSYPHRSPDVCDKENVATDMPQHDASVDTSVTTSTASPSFSSTKAQTAASPVSPTPVATATIPSPESAGTPVPPPLVRKTPLGTSGVGNTTPSEQPRKDHPPNKLRPHSKTSGPTQVFVKRKQAQESECKQQ